MLSGSRVRDRRREQTSASAQLRAVIRLTQAFPQPVIDRGKIGAAATRN